MGLHKILFFADRLPPLIGGMEIHAGYFIDYFINHHKFPLCSVITKNSEGDDCIGLKENFSPIDLENLANISSPRFVFFNSGRWIEELKKIRKIFPKACFIYRTGGNEILKAPLLKQEIPDHVSRQKYWINNLNDVIDLLITNSAFTEQRLRDIGVFCPFIRCVGGVNTSVLNFPNIKPKKTQPITIFCAARFVPYKNHALLILVMQELIKRGYDVRLRLVGDGPLLSAVKAQVQEAQLTAFVDFIGILDNVKTCQEIASANIYMQLSSDFEMKVPGGSYIHSEGMGRSILEALTMGTFVIAGKSGALPEIVSEERGLLVELDDFEHLVNKIEKVIKNIPEITLLEDNYCWTKIFSRYEQIFEQMNEDIISNRKM